VSKASSKKAETSKKVETKVTKTTTKTTTPLEQIKGLNLVSGIIYLILAVVSVVFVAPVSFKLTLDVMAIDQVHTERHDNHTHGAQRPVSEGLGNGHRLRYFRTQSNPAL
jgi:hypothetical protein